MPPKFSTFVRLLFFTCLLITVTHGAVAQCTPIYHKTYYGPGNDEAFWIVTTKDRGAIVAGRTTSAPPSYNGVLMKLHEDGSIQWVKSYGGIAYDELTKVKETSDGGFIALGNTSSFGHSKASWFMKTDAEGNLLWSKQISFGGMPSKAKDIIPLKDGGYAIALNLNDSSVSGDGLLVRTDDTGNTLWSKQFDHGNDDGLNNLLEDGMHLFVSGYSTVIDREGILMKVSTANGAMQWTKTFARRKGFHDEVINLDKINGGIAFGAESYLVTNQYNGSSTYLTLFKMKDDGTIFFQRRTDVSTASGYSIQHVEVKLAADSGFAYIVNDTTPTGWGTMKKVSAAGMMEWGKQPKTYGTQRINSIDIFYNTGYLMTGNVRSFFTGNLDRIQVMKTDMVGETGGCARDMHVNHQDTTNYEVKNFSWSNVAAVMATTTLAGADETGLNYKTDILCSNEYCPPRAVDSGTACLAGFLSHYKGDYNFVPFDVAKAKDGYIVVGYNRYFWSVEPIIMKVKFNGTVAWSKTLTNYIHSSDFEKVVITNDGNILVIGKDDLVINHAGYSGSVILKITTDGDFLWAKETRGAITDIVPAENGSYIGAMITNYGYPPIYMSIFKMDASGNFAWHKQLNKDYNAHALYRKLIYDGTFIYAGGEFYNEQQSSVEIAKLDLNGNRIWGKRFRVNAHSTTVEGLEMIGDSLYFMVNVWTPINGWTSKRNLGVVKISKQGDGLNAFTLSKPELIAENNSFFSFNSRFSSVTKTLDDHFVLASGVNNAADSTFTVTRFSPSGKIDWSKNYPNLKQHYTSAVHDDNGSTLVLARKLKGNYDYNIWYEPLLLRTDANGDVSKNGTGYCYSINDTPEMVSASLQELPGYTSDVSDVSYAVSNYIPIEKVVSISSNISCGLTGDCSVLKMSGSKSICNIEDTLEYTITKNASCNVPALWRYDTVYIKMIKITDSTIAVKFIKPGFTTITASISSGCGLISDSVKVNIIAPASSFTLGSDTALCPGNSVVLAAPVTFQTYLWQDGSTSKDFTIKGPGVYHLRVTDACGRTYADTILVSEKPPLVFDAGPDRVKCNSDTLHLDAAAGFTGYTWSNDDNSTTYSSQSIVIRPITDVTYYIKAEKEKGCFAYDTVRVKAYQSPKINLGNDTSFCFGQQLVLKAAPGFATYLWSDGSADQQLKITGAGTFSVAAITINGCKSFDTLTVSKINALPQTRLLPTGQICAGSKVVLNPGTFVTYHWQNGSSERTLEVSDTGRYWVKVRDNNGCENTGTTYINKRLTVPQNFLPAETELCSYATLKLEADRIFKSYSWSTGSFASSLIIDKPGVYTLEATDDNGCKGMDTVNVRPKDCMMGVFIPSAFSPGTDGKNDVFKALAYGPVKEFELSVYNRWGSLVYKTNDPSKGWDGKINGLPQDPAVYVWVCKYRLNDGETKVEKGTVTLIH